MIDQTIAKSNARGDRALPRLREVEEVFYFQLLDEVSELDASGIGFPMKQRDVKKAGVKKSECALCGKRGHNAGRCWAGAARSKPATKGVAQTTTSAQKAASAGKSRVTCFSCGQVGHRRANCPSILCLRCKGRGHLVRDCPVPDTRVCHKCGKSGHSAATCPE